MELGFKAVGRLTLAAIAVFTLTASVADAKPAPKTDAQVRQEMIRDSIASYPGNCPCPYNTARNGSSCGGRSAYSRGGGYAPLCYASDISKADVDRYRASHGIPEA